MRYNSQETEWSGRLQRIQRNARVKNLGRIRRQFPLLGQMRHPIQALNKRSVSKSL